MTREHHRALQWLEYVFPKNLTACCPAVVEELIGHFFSSDWMMVIEGFLHLIEKNCGRVEPLILIKSDLDMKVWLEK